MARNTKILSPYFGENLICDFFFFFFSPPQFCGGDDVLAMTFQSIPLTCLLVHANHKLKLTLLKPDTFHSCLLEEIQILQGCRIGERQVCSSDPS